MFRTEVSKKFYFLDVLVVLGGVFEFKAAESLVPRHRAQLMHYLMLAELWHGLLINVRPEIMGREFVNNSLTHHDRLQFRFRLEHWQPSIARAAQFQALLAELLSDWGTCLELGLYEDAITYFCGRESAVVRPATVYLDGHELGLQNMRFVTDKSAFKLTAFEGAENQHRFQSHGQCLVNHSDIECLLWANIGRHEVTLRVLTPER